MTLAEVKENMKVVVTEPLVLPLRRKEGEVVDLEEVLSLLQEMGVPHYVEDGGVYAPTSYDPTTDAVRLGGDPREQVLVAPRHWEGRPVRVVIPVVGEEGEVMPEDLLLHRLRAFPGGEAEAREDGVYAFLVKGPRGFERPFTLREKREAEWVKVAVPVEPEPQPKTEDPEGLEVPPEYLTRFLKEARAKGDLGAIARVAWAYRKAPLEVQEKVRALLERYAVLDQEGEGPLDGVYALGWREAG